MKIAGGFYREEMLSPAHQAYLGSGLRAAAALATTAPGVELHAYVSTAEIPDFNAVCVTYGVQAHQRPRAVPIGFSYAHGCSRPVLEPDIREIPREAPIEVAGDAVLRFGFLEGSCVVNAKRAVYDPQSEIAPEPFLQNGSTAKQWAIVLNVAEAEAFTGTTDPLKAARRLRKDQGCDVAVIKCGARGALVVTSTSHDWVPAYRTPSVFPLGSGDVFSATFAWYWAVKRADPLAAAAKASRATAFYCANRYLPLPLDVDRQARQYPPSEPRPGKSGMVYLAGPFFDVAQRWLIDELRHALLDQGLKVFSPIHDVGEGEATHVATKDLEGLRASSVVLACLDGMDTGTVFEIGYARARNIPVICLSTGPAVDADKTMLVGTACQFFRDVASAVYATAWLARGGKA